MSAVLDERPAHVPLAAACRALAVSRSAIYARRRRRVAGHSAPRTSRKHAPQPRAMSAADREHVLTVLNSERFRDQPPFEVFHALLSEGTRLCSIASMHRILRAGRQNGDRRDRREPQHHAVPRLCASAPNEVWSWDCTKIATMQRGVYLTVYVVLDLYSRYVPAWMISPRENVALATQMMREATSRYRIATGSLTIHQDRGAPMTAHRFIDQMDELGIVLSHSRPRVSNDNAMSEAQFATQKGQPDWPGRFASVAAARAWHTGYFDWYNFDHHHAGLAGFTPEQVFTGRHVGLAAVRQGALDRSYAAHPERFVSGPPTVRLPPATVSINPFTPEELTENPTAQVNMATLPRVIAKSPVSTI